ncbi:MAG: discoidin domain-containing protein [Phycisphaerae bacterium]|nr:discoidin domain-containing protein [Phycisphaerae bacterium]
MRTMNRVVHPGGVAAVWVVALGWAVPMAVAAGTTAPAVLKTEAFKHYVERLNADDEELYANIPNAKAWEFLAANVPLLECPDKDIERTYYFRWWTYRKHVKKTPDGFVITEFLPTVPWSAKHNTISCPAGHHFYEGRWLRDRRYMDDYAVFWFRKGGSPRRYSFWAADAIHADFLVRQNRKLTVDLLDDLVKNYKGWEKSLLTPDGLFWQIDDRDGMEVSVGKSGKRATINSYMYGGAMAIAKIATMAGRADVKAEYEAKAARLKHLVQTKLWDDKAKFFKTLKRSDYERGTPMHSGDGSVLRMHWWSRERLGKPQWIQYDLKAAASIDSVEVYWHDDGSGIRLPKSWRVTVRDGGQWKPLANTTPYEIAPDRMNKVKFAPVKAGSLRLEVQSQAGKVGGLYEWRVLSKGRNVAAGAKATASFPTKRGRLGDPLKGLNDGEGKSNAAALVDVREQHGFTPWYFNLPDAGRGYEVAWKQLMDPKGFYAPFGPTTAEQRHPGFKVVYQGHGCQWNGPSWPLATAVTLTGMANVLNNYTQDAVTRADYLKTLKVYTNSHRRKRTDGKVVSWIDENIDPFTGVWIARTMLLAADARRRAEGKTSNHIKERGKDYNHSSYCDLVITGLVGLRPRADDTVEVNPLVPAGEWDYFCLDHVAYHGRILTIVWDKTGKKYHRGAGLYVLVDGKEIARSKTLTRITGRLDSRATPRRGRVGGP